MIEDIKKFKINWIDGMKISKEHFQGLQDFSSDSIKDAIGLQMTKFGYGLLPPSFGNNNKYSINIDTHKCLKIVIKGLRAITPNGNRINITDNTPLVKEEIIVEEFDNKDLEVGFVLINIDTENLVAFGEQATNEVPPRYPFITNGYFFSFINEKELKQSGLSGNQLPIAKITKQGNSLAVDLKYIPPSITLDAHSSLVDFYNNAETFLKSIEQNAILIAQKIKTKQSDNPIADSMYIVVDKIYPYIAEQITTIRWEECNMQPNKILNIIVSFSRLFKGSVDVSSAENKEQLFNYFGEWTNLNGGDYEKVFTNIININYNHTDIYQNLEVVSEFMSTTEKLFSVLTQVDYIGKRRDIGIFVNENIVEKKSNKSSSSSFLAE